MTGRITFLLLTVALLACSHERSMTDTPAWEPIFNGQDLSGWKIKVTGSPLGVNFNNTFTVEDSMIRVNYAEYDTFNGEFGHIFYSVPYSYYKVRFEYRFTGEQVSGGPGWARRNSGIMLHAQLPESMEVNQTFPVSIEFQLLGGLGTGERSTGNVCTPGTTVSIDDTVRYAHCINSLSPTYHGDDWVRVEAVVLGGERMSFLIEGDTVLQLQSPAIGDGFTSQRGGDIDWERNGVVENRARWQSLDGTLLEEGYLALQAESHPADFRNIELLNLCGCMDSTANNYKSYYVKHKPDSCIYPDK